MRLNVAAKRGTDAAQKLNKVDGDDSPNHVDESSAEILGLIGSVAEEAKPAHNAYESDDRNAVHGELDVDGGR